MNRTLLDLWVGVFVALGFAALAFVALKVANLTTFGETNSYRVTAEFENIGGLKVRAPVRSSGVVVGRVADIQLDTKKYQAVVTMELEQRYPFTSDTSAQILTSGILGEQYVGLDAGGDQTNLKEGDKITITSSALVLEQLISNFMFSKASEEKPASEAKPAAGDTPTNEGKK